MKHILTKFPALILILAIVSAICAPQVLAQFGGATPQKRTVDEKKNKVLYKTNLEKKLLTIPYVPNYPATGKNIKLLRALNYPNAGKGTTCLVQGFLVKDGQAEILSWYNSTLKSYGWKVAPGNRTGTQIFGRKMKEGCLVQVMVTKASREEIAKGFKSFVNVRFNQTTPS